jgi:glycerol uptake facilitator-like aquaporin
MGTVLLIALLAFIINIPFGYLRNKTRKFSARWFLYVHLSIPLIIAARLLSHTDYRYIPIFILAAVAGQILGGRIEVNL